MDKLDLTIRGDVERLHVEPTDVVIVKIRNAARYGNEQAERIRQTVMECLRQVGIDNPVLVIDSDNIDLEVAGQ